MPPHDTELGKFTSEIVAAYVSNHAIEATAMPALIRSVYDTLLTLSLPSPQPVVPVMQPVVPIKKSVFPDYIICLEDGRRFKMLKRYLQTSYSISPEEYRAKWGLPKSYPMTAPNYASKRSALAKKIGLGAKPKTSVPPVESLGQKVPEGRSGLRRRKTPKEAVAPEEG